MWKRICFALFVLAGCSTLSQLPQTPTTNYVETVVVPFNSVTDVLTTQLYADWTFLYISGSGNISADRISDAFCRYDLNNQIVIEDGNDYGIRVDGHIRLFTTSNAQNIPSKCNYDHEYLIAYRPSSDTPVPIAFRSVDATVADNSGIFTIRISREMPPELRRGR